MNTLAIKPIDITSFTDGSDKKSVVESIRNAAEEIGFFTITGHGLSHELIDTSFNKAREFFQQPLDVKSKVPNSGTIPARGYYPYGAGITPSEREPKRTEVRETFSFYMPEDETYLHEGEGETYFQQITWPEGQDEFKDTFLKFNSSMRTLSHNMWRIFALALDLPEDYFAVMNKNPTSFTGINYYKPVPQWTSEYGEFRIPAHTDITICTMIFPEGNGEGFQLELRNGEWVTVDLEPGSMIVQLGDMMKMWTNDRWLAAKHRVIPPPPSEADNSRISILMGVQTDYDAKISCLETCQSEDNLPKYAPTTCSQYEVSRMSRMIRGRAKENETAMA